MGGCGMGDLLCHRIRIMAKGIIPHHKQDTTERTLHYKG